jgi:hypothetical protein
MTGLLAGPLKDATGVGAVHADLAGVVQQVPGPARVSLRISPCDRGWLNLDRRGDEGYKQSEGPTPGKQIAYRDVGPSLRWPVRRSPLGERRNAAPAKRYSAKAIGAARGTQPHRLLPTNARAAACVPVAKVDLLRREKRKPAAG